MQNILLLSVLSLVSIAGVSQTTSVLFLGNSYTGTNGLVPKFYDLCLAAGDTVYTDSNTPGGYTLEGHSTNATSIAKINERDWDFVVLQEQSQRPSFPPGQVANEVYPYAEILCDTIRANNECTEPVFYMTWGRRIGDQNNCQFYTPLCSFEGMSTRLRSSYLEMAEDNDARVAPCGAAWSRMDIADTTFFAALYTNDGSHPSVYGQYLNACVFYATIFKKTPVGIPYYSTISQIDAETLQAYAEEIVIDSLDNWNVNAAWPVANADYDGDGPTTVQFSQNSENATNHTWIFGDGNTSSNPSPSHNYGITNMTFDVLYIATDNCGRSDTMNFQVTTGLTGVVELADDFILKSQSGGIFQLSTKSSTAYVGKLESYDGRLIRTFNRSTAFEINLSNQRSAVYLLTLTSDSGNRKVIKLTR